METRGLSKIGVVASIPFVDEILNLLYDIRWLLLLGAVLILADLKTGIERSKAQGKEVRKSKATRRTLNKVVDYVCLLLVASILGVAIGEPLGLDHMVVAVVIMAMICLTELDSIIQNYYEARGMKGFSIRKVVISYIKKKNEDVGAALETTEENENNGDNQERK